MAILSKNTQLYDEENIDRIEGRNRNTKLVYINMLLSRINRISRQKIDKEWGLEQSYKPNGPKKIKPNIAPTTVE